MASESTEDRTVSLSLPTELADWLDEQAGTLDVEREELLVQLLSSYRTTAELDGDLDSGELVLDDEVDSQLEEEVAETVQKQIEAELEDITAELAGRVDERVAELVSEALADQLNEATNAVQRQLGNRIDSVEEDYKSKLDDVRDRVIQVKKETDAKAPKDHTHEEFERLTVVADQLDTLEAEVEQLREEYDESVPQAEESIERQGDQLEEMQDRLQTVAWVVSDLREMHESGGGLQAVDRIKRAAAKADIERAKCENCGNGVALSLLTDPKCPHCEATVTNVEPASGWFSDPKLLVASQLESGEDR